jgi:hypothetical protein
LIISIDAEKAFGKIQCNCLIKALMKLGIEGMYLNIYNIITGVYNRPIAINSFSPLSIMEKN